MTPRRRKVRKPGVEHLSAEQWDVLLSGDTFGPSEVFDSEDDRRATWQSHRDTLLRFWTAGPGWEDVPVPEMAFYGREPRGPGHRPQGWWDYDAPGHRELVDPQGWIERETSRRYGSEDYALWVANNYSDWTGDTCMGVPSGESPDGDGHMHPDYRFIESQRAFLERHDLLLPWEKTDIPSDNGGSPSEKAP